MTIDLRECQSSAIKMIGNALRDGCNAPTLVASTGFGKSRSAAFMADAYANKGKRVLFLAPRRTLVFQMWESFRDLGVDAGIIMAGVEPKPDLMIQIASIDTVLSRIERPYSDGRIAVDRSSLIIVDESHLFSSEKRAEFINRIRNGGYGDGKVVVMMTATPCVSSGGGLGNISDRLVVPISMRELIAQGHLLQPEYYAAPAPDLSGIRIINGDYDTKQLGEAYDDKLMGCIVENWFNIAPNSSSVIFTATRAGAASLTDQFKDRGITAEYLDCYTLDDKRKRIFDATKCGDNLIVVNVAIIGIGSDLPALSTVSLAMATKSVSRYMQAVGRVLRPYGDQTHATVIDHGNNVRRLGRCEDITDWTLDERININERAEKAASKPDKKEIKCSECSHLFRGASTCPKCGHKIPDKKVAREEIEFTPARLQRIDGKPSMTAAEKRNKTMDIAQKANIYGQFSSYVASKGKDPNYAKHLYREYMGVWPHSVSQAKSMPPGAEVMGFIKHRAIKQSYSKKGSA